MKQKIFKNLVALSLSLLIITTVLAVALPVQATNLNPWGNDQLKQNVQTITGLGNRDPRDIASSVINVILGFLGIVAVVIILIGGFKWMTAGGNEDKVSEAQKLITAGVIGLIIILAAYAIAKFVLDQLVSATNAT